MQQITARGGRENSTELSIEGLETNYVVYVTAEHFEGWKQGYVFRASGHGLIPHSASFLLLPAAAGELSIDLKSNDIYTAKARHICAQQLILIFGRCFVWFVGEMSKYHQKKKRGAQPTWEVLSIMYSNDSCQIVIKYKMSNYRNGPVSAG